MKGRIGSSKTHLVKLTKQVHFQVCLHLDIVSRFDQVPLIQDFPYIHVFSLFTMELSWFS